MFAKRTFVALLTASLFGLALFQAGAAVAAGGSVDLGGPHAARGEMKASAVTESPITASASAGGGIWDYGVDGGGWSPFSKGCYSNYFHRFKVHSSTAVVGKNIRFSGKVSAGKWSHARVTGSVFDHALAYWNTY